MSRPVYRGLKTSKAVPLRVTHVMTATVFLFMDSSMPSCVSCAVSSRSWD